MKVNKIKIFKNDDAYENNKSDIQTTDLVLTNSFDMVIEQNFSDNYWYRRYSNGYLEQGGIGVATSGRETITFPIPFLSDSPIITIKRRSYPNNSTDTGGVNYVCGINKVTNLSVNFSIPNSSGYNWLAGGWEK